MSEYKMIVAGKGFRYLKDNRFIPKATIPANIFVLLDEPNKVIDDSTIKLEAPVRECIFCGVVCKKQRLVNGQTVAVCDDHYYSKNMGQTAQRIRELKEGVPTL